MKIFTYCLLLFVVIGLVPIASADGPIQSFRGTPDGTDESLFSYGESVYDDVIPVLEWNMNMNTLWIDPDNNLVISMTANVPQPVYHFYLFSAPVEGTWSVVATETSYNGNKLENTATFDVAAMPEFSLGSFIILIFAGVLYFLMRRTAKGSLNVG